MAAALLQAGRRQDRKGFNQSAPLWRIGDDRQSAQQLVWNASG